ncbi:acyl carrier protein [Lachnospiraceae bacterium]|nr:acyl carrier protein [Lachnospiraceae bacterium]
MEKEIIEVIAPMSLLDVDEITENDLFSDIGVDSLKLVEIIMNLEDRFNITFADFELNPENLTTVKSVIALVKRYL